MENNKVRELCRACVRKHDDSFLMASYFLHRTLERQNSQLRLLSKSSKMHLLLSMLC